MIRRLTRPGRGRRSGGDGATDDRTTITRLFRNPPQLAVLTELLGTGGPSALVRIYGVADGAEAVSVLVSLAPAEDATLRIEGFDISDDYLRAADDLSFTRGHFAESVDPAAFSVHLEPTDGGWRLRDRWRRFLTFDHGDVMRAGGSAPADVVMCQNTLVGFPPEDAVVAVSGLVAELKPGGLLLVGGGQLDVVPAAVCRLGLVPVLDDVEAIHEAWEVQRRFWANEHPPWWALEPFDADHPDGAARYCTIFRRPEETDA